MSFKSNVPSTRVGNMATNFRIEDARKDDIPEIMSVLIPSFQHIPIEGLLDNVDTIEARKAAGERHVRAWSEHAADFATPCAIKCVHTDPSTGKETIVGFAEWYIYDKERSPKQYRKEHFLLSASWVPEDGGQREKAKRWLAPVIEKRIKWMGGRPYGLFMYMCVDRAWRRRGVSTMCVQWGLDKCRQWGIPAYLEASEEGEHVYKRMGFVEADKIHIDLDGVADTAPVMICWPPGTKEEEKKPTCP